jgi:uncharacterized protein (DUF697 family)
MQMDRAAARHEAQHLVEKWAVAFARVALIPGSHYVTSAGDAELVTRIGKLYGVELDRVEAAAVFATVAAPLLASNAAHSVLNLMPVIGWLAKPAVALGAAKAVGTQLIQYFESRISANDGARVSSRGDV